MEQLEMILEEIFTTGQKFAYIADDSQVPEFEWDKDLSENQVVYYQSMVYRLSEIENHWPEEAAWETNPGWLWRRLEHDSYAAGLQGQPKWDTATSPFGAASPESRRQDLAAVAAALGDLK